MTMGRDRRIADAERRVRSLASRQDGKAAHAALQRELDIDLGRLTAEQLVRLEGLVTEALWPEDMSEIPPELVAAVIE